MVALVVTIVVLLILASISIQGITRTGIFRAAEDTKLEHKRASIATTLQTKLKINQTEQIRGTDEEIIKATYEDVKNDLEQIKKAGGKDIEVGEVTSEEKNGKTEWFFEVKVDGDVYKVGLDGSDYLGKEDELSPVIQIKNATATTNTITATVTTRRNEGGKIEYYIKEKGASKFDLAGTTDQNTFKYTKLKQETTYVIEAVAINTNGKKKISNEYEIKTSLVPKIDSKEIKFASVPNTWTNKSVEVTATLTVDGQNFTLATSKNPTSGWIASNRQIFTENGTMYAALTDGNNYGAAASYEVTNIDTVKPVIKNITATTNTIKITATDEASGIYSYAISESETMPKTFTTIDNNTKIFNKIFENLKQTTKYYVWVKDVAGNISEVASTKTETVPKLTDANATITKSPNDWTKQEVTATASTTEKNYTLQTKKDNGEWQTTNTQKFTENGTIYARLWDGTNAGEEIYKTITNIDKIAPNAFIPKTTVTTNSITVDGTTTDAIATDTNGCSGVKEYRFSKDGGKTYTGAQTSSIYTFNELTQKTEYPIVVEVKDNAENITTGKINVTTNTIPKASGATYTPTTWTKGNVTVTLTTMKEYSTVYTTDGTAPTKDSTKYSGTFTVSSNCKIKYLYTDGINIGEAGELDITNIDKTAPTATSVEIKNVTPAGYDVYVYGVQDNGSGVNRVQFPTWTEANGQDDIQPNWQTGESSKGTKQADGTTWVYHVNITDHKTEAGIYNTHIYAYDNLENNKFIGGQKITVPKVKITYDENYVKDGTTNKQTVEKVYNTELGTLGTPTRTGYTFAGWFTEATGGTQISNTTKTPVTDTTYYAHWTANTYTIVYNGNGATGGSTAGSTATYDQNVTIASNGFAKTGYSFAGWTTKSDGSDDGYGWTNWKGTWKYVDGQYGIANRKLQLYARWTPNKYTISYNGNGATGGSTANTTATYDQNVTIATNGFTKTGYSFAGWTTKSDGSDDGYGWTGWKGTWKYVDGQYGIASGKLQLYARWTINSYSLTVAPNGGSYNSNTSNTTVTRKYQDYYTLMSPTRTGYTFNNWTLSGSGTLMRGIGNGRGSGVGGFTATEKTENGEKYTNYTFNTTATTNTWYSITFPNYAIDAGHTYEISLYMRVNSMSNASLDLRHACINNDYSSTGRVAQVVNGTTSGWVKYVLRRTYSGTTIASSNGNSNVTVRPLFEMYTSNLNNAGKTTSMNFDIRDVVVKDVTNNTYKYTTNYIYDYGAENGTVTANWGANQLNFVDQTISKTFSTSPQTANITGASNGTGSYIYTSSDKNASGTAKNYISIDGTTINIAANTPVGTYTYYILATDNNSKVSKEAKYTINIERAKTSSASAANKTYNGKSQTGVTGGGITWSGTTSGIDAGTYTATATPDGNHAWSDGTTGAKTITWTMSKKTVAVTWGTTTTFNYNGSAQAPTVSAASGVTGETINVTRTTGTNAGSYTSNASISSVSGGRAKAGNYALSGNTKAFTIARAKTASASAANKTYNGASQTGVTGGGVTWSGTTAAIDAGTYTANATPDGNHAWSDGTTGAKTITWTMNKKTVGVTWGATSFTYNGSAQGPTASAASGVTGETINITRSTATNAGSYTSTASISGVTGGRAKAGNYTLSGNTKAFTIARAKNASASASNKTYNGNSQTGVTGGGVTWSGTTSGIDAGTYTANATPDANHAWSDGTTGAKTITWTMNKKTVGVTWGATSFTYNGSAQGPTASATSGVTGETINVTRTTATNAGSYTSTASISSVSGGRAKAGNYTLSGNTKAFTIARAKNASASAANKTYNGNSQTGVTGGGVTWSGTTSGIDAGTYTANATPDANHAWSDGTTGAKTITWTMSKKTVAVTWGATTFTYNGNAQAPTASATSGVTGETINITRTTGTNAGSYTSTASISSVSGGRAKAGNYTLSGTTKAFTINPSSTAVKVYYPTSATAVSSKTVYRNKCSSTSTVLSTTNTGINNNVIASTYSGLYGTFSGYATTVNSTTKATTSLTGITSRTETTYYLVTTSSNTSSITATFNYYNGSAWTSTTKSGTRTNNYTYYCTSTSASTIATSYSHGAISAPSTSTGPYSTAYVGWSTSSKSMSTTSTTTANTTYYAVYRSNVTVKYITGTAATNVSSKTIYRNAMKDGTFLSESNTGTSNLTTISGADGYVGLAISTGTTTCTTITTCATSTIGTFYTVGKKVNTSMVTVTYKYQNGSNDTTSSGTKMVTKNYYINSSNQVASNSSSTNPQFTMPNATKTGCNFAGWNTNSTATSARYTAGQKVSIGDNTTLYAIWIINGSVGLSATSGSTCTGKATTFTVNSNPSGGTLSVSSANTGIATTSISGTTVTVTPKAIGSTTITVTSAANKNYTSASNTYTITVGNHNATTGGALKSAATCTAAAVYYHKCSICGTGLSSTYSSGSALGHNYASTKRMGSWSWTANTGTWSAANAQGMKTAMFNNAGTYARFTYTSYGAHTMRILYFGAQTGYSLDFCLGTSTNATASGVTGYRGWAGGTVQLWVGGKLNSTVNHGASAGNGVYNSYIDWGHGGSGSWTFTIHANSPNTGAHPASCIRYYCSRCSHYEDRYAEY